MMPSTNLNYITHNFALSSQEDQATATGNIQKILWNMDVLFWYMWADKQAVIQKVTQTDIQTRSLQYFAHLLGQS